MNRWRSRFFEAWISSQVIKLHVPVTRSILSSLGLRGWFTWSLVPLKGCRSKDTPDGSSYVVLGRYFRTVVAWARQKFVETPCLGADVYNG